LRETQLIACHGSYREVELVTTMSRLSIVPARLKMTSTYLLEREAKRKVWRQWKVKNECSRQAGYINCLPSTIEQGLVKY